MMRDQQFVAHDSVKPTLSKYKNPRKLPENWIRAYLERDKEMLALDVMRAFDETAELKRRERLKFWYAVALLLLSTFLGNAPAILRFLARLCSKK